SRDSVRLRELERPFGVRRHLLAAHVFNPPGGPGEVRRDGARNRAADLFHPHLHTRGVPLGDDPEIVWHLEERLAGASDHGLDGVVMIGEDPTRVVAQLEGYRGPDVA